jgi:rhodanese-related sulfurtransferase
MLTEATREQVRQLAATGAQVVDVLTAAEYRSAHLPGAVNLPLKELDARTDQLDRSRPVIVYCHDTV